MKTEKHKKIFEDIDKAKEKNLERIANKLLKDDAKTQALKQINIDLTNFFNERDSTREQSET